MTNLTAKFCASVKARKSVKSYGDGRGGHGLRLIVRPAGSKAWYQKLYYAGAYINVGLGSFPDVGLQDARERAMRNRLAVKDGQDPRRQDPFAVSLGAESAPAFRKPSVGATVAELVDGVIAAKRGEWKNAERMESQWRSSLKHAPGLMAMKAAEVTPADVLATLEPLAAKLPTVAPAVKSRLGEAMDRAVVLGLRQDNPVSVVKLPKRKGGNFAAMPWKDVPKAVATLLAADEPMAYALAFQILTAARSSEALGLRTGEVEGDLWTVPGERMKAKREHRVPLSPQALSVLEQAKPHGVGTIAFPGKRGSVRNGGSHTETMRRYGLEGTAHGFRSAFRDWCAEQGEPRELAEAALAHVVGGVEGAYFRSDLLERRRELMNRWGAFVLTGEAAPV
ncbi:MAG: DUF4102 domain-containing protein [Gammaproteobacteria bacterium]|nr:DUF4102 domain-containing protein [Gammaproteobacteria bacterium]